MQMFGMRSARSSGFIAVIAGALALETSVLHVVLSVRHPWIAWALTASSLYAIWWIATDHAKLATTTIAVDGDRMRGTIGKRASFDVSLASIASVERPRLMPSSGPPTGYLNVTKPAAPNVLIVFRSAVTITVLGMARSVSQLALRVDDPEALMRVVAVR